MRSSRESSSSAKPAKKSKSKTFRFELGFMQLLLYFFSLLMVLAWMFVFGVLIGRGLPLVKAEDTSLSAQVLRFMGLGREEVPDPPAKVAESWQDSREMLGSLNYYQSLTNETDPISGKPLIKSPIPSAPQAKDSTRKTTQPSSKPSVEQASSEEAEQPRPTGTLDTANQTEHFTLLAASLKDSSNAERLVKKLQAKGYTPTMETIDMPESGRWTRVLVGSFDSREEALKFAAQFNRKENVQGLVIRVDR